jgi:hypothetical protein
LTPPQTRYSEVSSYLKFEFWPDSFTLSSTATIERRIPRYDFVYNDTILDILRSLETGIICPSLACLIEKMKFTGWDCGTLIAEITDYRSDPVIRNRVQLAIGEAVIRHRLSSLTDTDQLETECELLKLSMPAICIDPSPNVARLQSVSDWRHKAWIDRRDREFGPKPAPPPSRFAQSQRIPDLPKARQATVELPAELVEELLQRNVKKEQAVDPKKGK